MKKILLILLLFTASLSAQVGTGNISLEEVLEEMFPGANHTSLSLLNCISYANINGNWDPTYSGDKNSLLNFRGYTRFIPPLFETPLTNGLNGYVVNVTSPEILKCTYLKSNAGGGNTVKTFKAVPEIGDALWSWDPPYFILTSFTGQYIQRITDYVFVIHQISNGVVTSSITSASITAAATCN